MEIEFTCPHCHNTKHFYEQNIRFEYGCLMTYDIRCEDCDAVVAYFDRGDIFEP